MIITPTKRQQDVLYSDLRKDMLLSPVNSDVSRYTDEDSVKESIKNLLLTDTGERLFNPSLGSNIRRMLFENILYPETRYIIKESIGTAITNFEPRAILQAVTALPDYDRNAYEVKIEFYVVNTPTELVDMSVLLERLR